MRSRELDSRAASPPDDDGELLELRRATRARSASTTCSRRCAAALSVAGAAPPHPDRPVVPARAGGAASAAIRDGGRSAASGRSRRSTPARPSSPRSTPYFYSAWERPQRSGSRATRCERGERESVVILGSGPNRIGQGIEFDYCCVHAAQTVRESGRDAVMINCNPETVSTDYDTSDRLYFEPLTLERRARGLRARAAARGGRPVRRPDAAEARQGAAATPACRSSAPGSTRSTSPRTARGSARCSTRSATRRRRTRPRPAARRRCAGGRASASRCWCGRATCSADARWRSSTTSTACASTCSGSASARPAVTGASATIYLDRFLEDSIEVDVDALCDGEDVWIAGVMQHVEEAGMHSGDSACVLPPHALGEEHARADPRADRRDRARARRRRPAQRPVRDPRRGRACT